MKVGERVMPKNNPVGDKGYVWEHLLNIAGWNKLPESEKPLVVTSVDSDGNPASVNHPVWGAHGDMVVFADEVVPA